MEPEPITVVDVVGEHVEAELFDRTSDGSLLLRGPDGRRWRVPADAIDRHEGTDLHVTVRLAELDALIVHEEAPSDRRVIPLVEERLVVETRLRPTTTVRVRTRTHVRQEAIDEVLSSESVHVDRVPIDRYVDEPASVRVEGDTTIVPVHEEVLFVEKRLVLKEELHLTKRTADRHETQHVSLRYQTADVERTDSEATSET